MSDKTPDTLLSAISDTITALPDTISENITALPDTIAALPEKIADIVSDRLFCNNFNGWDIENEEFEDLTRESAGRYAAYLLRAKTVLSVKAYTLAKAGGASIRYAAYSSDVGEALRPVISPMWVNATYGLAISYVIGDIAYHGYLEQQREGGDVKRAVAHATSFQLLASLLIPALLIHKGVHLAHKGFTRAGRFTKWGPSVVGLAMIPMMPLIDHPIEHAIDYTFDTYWDVIMKAEAKENKTKEA
mmetsp:Transcript_40722/g.68175  ORF Transcript_40722/g.68175 Transcript_40722/m.68175 type:complete len:246 (+) Transcript_40722:160-897(+)|eukprot:CAMPEP_0198207620 /NCGR_PEP_ID=MMETSP1445-20131203/11060_1 /TAXON_ID=36898 /ORGANISM="Pyramimonas sp., Strain CCMP2087" /LENGTH=245 /DNA_ID=CAMNT_0043880725 /DNA_START=149 /DNA_END=886 /DNA_ORIENTATION=-